jgi:hypothetical protein
MLYCIGLESVYELAPQRESSFRRKPGSSPLKTFRMPDQVRHNGLIDFTDRHYLNPPLILFDLLTNI